MKQKSFNPGFTLIELLVVISIIGLLASVVLVSMNSARAKARDAQRLANKKQVVTALNLYYNANSVWPVTTGAAGFNCLAPSAETCWGGSMAGSDALVTALQPYLAAFPKNNADSGNAAYDRLVFNSNLGAGTLDCCNPAGAYLIWVQEISFPVSNCSSEFPPQHYDKYYYCYEYLGK